MPTLLDLLNPCYVCTIIASVVLLISGIALGGYTGKYIYVSSSHTQLNWSQVLTSDHFWTPDWTFWCFGLFTVIVVFTSVAIVNAICAGVSWCALTSCRKSGQCIASLPWRRCCVCLNQTDADDDLTTALTLMKREQTVLMGNNNRV